MADDQPVRAATGFEAAVHAESGRLFAVAYSILRDPQEAEDASAKSTYISFGS
jgi:DNA-directed RNA polymerase specialized sigma24 family protein